MKKYILGGFAILVIAGLYIARPLFIQEVTVEEQSAEEIMKTVPKEDPNVLPTFEEIEVDFTHVYNKKVLAFAGGSLIDIDNDGVDEVFIGGGHNQDDAILTYTEGKFTKKLIENKKATYGSIALDLDKDADHDLVVAREDGLFIYRNTESLLTPEKIEYTFEKNTRPLSITASDINQDGHADLYISTFIDAANFKAATFNDPNHGKKNVLLLNNGDNTFTDITDKAGVGVRQNTFLSVFTDLNNDGWQDLVLSNNTDTVQVFKNNGDQTFEEKKVPGNYGFWMGLAVGDIDNDGDRDLFFSNIGNTVPVQLATGDAREDQPINNEWLLLQNDGDFNFTDVTAAKKLTGLEFAWGALFEDFNNDGHQDLSVQENYIKWTAHKLSKLPGRFFTQKNDGTFMPITKAAGVENFNYGMSTLTSDFNQDGYQDMLYINLDGTAKAFINTGGKNHHVNVVVPATPEFLGARIRVTAEGKTQTKEVMTGIGLLSDQTKKIHFGLGNAEKIESIVITMPSGITKKVSAEIDSSVTIQP